MKRKLGLVVFVKKKRDRWKKDTFKKCKWANGSTKVNLQKKIGMDRHIAECIDT